MFTVKSAQKFRGEYGATYDLVTGPSGDRVQGKLTRDGLHLRDFNVKIAPTGDFAVDIGTGSGVKVKFRHVAELV